MKTMRRMGLMGLIALVMAATSARGAWTAQTDFVSHFNVSTAGKVSIAWAPGNAVLYPTNAAALTVDLSQPYGDLNQAANFSFTGVANVSSTNYQTAVVFVGNTVGTPGGTPISIGAPASTHTQGTWNCTNVTAVSFFCSAGRWTNAVAVPLW